MINLHFIMIISTGLNVDRKGLGLEEAVVLVYMRDNDNLN